MDIRKAWPLHDNVQDGPRAFGRWMTAARNVDIDDPYWRARLGDGSIALTDPAPLALPPGDESEKVAPALPPDLVPVEAARADIGPGETAILTLDTEQPVKE